MMLDVTLHGDTIVLCFMSLQTMLLPTVLPTAVLPVDPGMGHRGCSEVPHLEDTERSQLSDQAEPSLSSLLYLPIIYRV